MVKPHGIRGEVVVNVLSDVDGRMVAGDEVLLDGKPTIITSSRPHQGRLLVVFEAVPDRTAAEGLRGALIEAARADVGEEEHFYAHELVGVAVSGPDGEQLGEVVDIILMPPAAGYDLLEVRHPDGHVWLLPAADDLVEVVEDEDGTLFLEVFDLPEGLVDPSAGDVVPGTDGAAPEVPATDGKG